MLNYRCCATETKKVEWSSPLVFCNFPGCQKNVIDKFVGICPSCIYKVSKFEERLDRWLATFHPDLALEDVMGWYCKCLREKCVRDCLDQSYYYQGCECCPCNLQLGYISRRINNQMYPDKEWMDELRKQINDF